MTTCNRRTPKNGCGCYADGFFGYDPATCRVGFATHVVRDGCRLYSDHRTLNLTLVVRDYAGQVVPGVFYSSEGVLSWSRFKPVAGTYYSATLTLTCSDGSVVTRTIEYTVPVDIVYGAGCSCCTQRRLDYVAITATGCCSFATGTWGLVKDPNTCFYYGGTGLLADPSNGCAGACFSNTHGANTYHLWPIELEIIAEASAVGGNFANVTLRYTWKIYRQGASCVHYSTPQSQIIYNFECNSAAAAHTVNTSSEWVALIGISNFWYRCPAASVSLGVSNL